MRHRTALPVSPTHTPATTHTHTDAHTHICSCTFVSLTFYSITTLFVMPVCLPCRCFFLNWILFCSFLSLRWFQIKPFQNERLETFTAIIVTKILSRLTWFCHSTKVIFLSTPFYTKSKRQGCHFYNLKLIILIFLVLKNELTMDYAD